METNILKSPYDIYKYVPKVRIDEGVFKYVQIKAYFKTSKKKLRFVRGYTRFGLHADIYEDFLSEFKISDLRNMSIQGKKGSPMKVLDAVEFKCKGGGRIAHSTTEKKILVYGYSQTFGQCKHKETIKLLKEVFPDYKSSNFQWTNEGY